MFQLVGVIILIEKNMKIKLRLVKFSCLKNKSYSHYSEIFKNTHYSHSALTVGGSVLKNPPANAGDVGLTPGWERSLGGGNGNPLQYCLENPMDRRSWQAIEHRVTKSWT